MGRMRTLVIFAVVAFVVALVLPGRTMAQQGKVIELTYGSPYGPDHTFSKTDKRWIAKIEKETNGRVKIKPFWGGAIIGGGSDAMDEVVKGVADIGFVSPGQARSGYEFAKANFLFFSNASIANVRPIFMEVLKKFP
jgi:TRAP-type C4-dicarboxylate transport system substrate-binding protein